MTSWNEIIVRIFMEDDDDQRTYEKVLEGVRDTLVASNSRATVETKERIND